MTERQWMIGGAVTLAIVGVLAIVALVLASMSFSGITATGVYMTRTTSTAQSITGGIAQVVAYDVADKSSGDLVYADGVFTAQTSMIINISAQVSVNVTGTGGGGTTLSPLTMFVTKGGSSIAYGVNNSAAAYPTLAAYNTQYGTISTGLLLNKGDTFSVRVLTATTQQLLGNADRWLTITGEKLSGSPF